MTKLPEGRAATRAVEDDIIQERHEQSQPRRVIVADMFGHGRTMLTENVETRRRTSIARRNLDRYVIVGHGAELWWPERRILG